MGLGGAEGWWRGLEDRCWYRGLRLGQGHGAWAAPLGGEGGGGGAQGGGAGAGGGAVEWAEEAVRGEKEEEGRGGALPLPQGSRSGGGGGHCEPPGVPLLPTSQGHLGPAMVLQHPLAVLPTARGLLPQHPHLEQGVEEVEELEQGWIK